MQKIGYIVLYTNIFSIYHSKIYIELLRRGMNEMNRRKIQKTGTATYTVSMPKVWITRNGIKPGDAVSIHENNDQSLRIMLEQKKEELREETINLNEFKNDTEVVRKFTAHYVNGAARIIVLANGRISHEYKKKIVSQLKKVIGFEIVEETEGRIVLQDFFSSHYLSLTNTISRQFKLSRLIMEESRKILGKEVKDLENIKLWEDEINKLYLLARRQINFALHDSIIMGQLKIDVNDCQDYLIQTGAIEKMADVYCQIGMKCIDAGLLSIKWLEHINRLFDQVLQAYTMANDSISKKDFLLSNKAISLCESIMGDGNNLEGSRLAEKTKVNLYAILLQVQMSTNFIKELAETGMDRS